MKEKNISNNISDDKLLEQKPLMMWEYRIYSKGSLLENGIVLNETANFVYQKCNGNNTVSNILSKLCKNYDVKENRARRDLLAIIRSLINEGAIKI